MNTIPQTEHALVLRTDFSDPGAWDTTCAEIRKPVGIFGFLAYVDYLDDAQYADITKEQILSLLPPRYNHSFIIVADRMTMEHPEHPLMIVELFWEPGREFRAIPREVQAIENNLSIANMDFEDFADNVDEDGIFRGFPGNPDKL